MLKDIFVMEGVDDEIYNSPAVQFGKDLLEIIIISVRIKIQLWIAGLKTVLSPNEKLSIVL